MYQASQKGMAVPHQAAVVLLGSRADNGKPITVSSPQRGPQRLNSTVSVLETRQKAVFTLLCSGKTLAPCQRGSTWLSTTTSPTMEKPLYTICEQLKVKCFDLKTKHIFRLIFPCLEERNTRSFFQLTPIGDACLQNMWRPANVLVASHRTKMFHLFSVRALNTHWTFLAPLT